MQLPAQLSPRSSYQRFFIGGFRVTDTALDGLLCVGGNGRAFVAVEGRRIVAHAMWANPRGETRRADLAFVVAADRRGQGLAVRLTRLAMADATERGMVQAEATVLADNAASQRVLSRVLPTLTLTRAHGEIRHVTSLDAASRCLV